ncbi:MAG: type II toxin-antitoxin system mRNA interferase toxin, RelE/StbE family, partial [bacterium]
RDHPLIGPWVPSRDCHLETDWILIYTAAADSLRLERTGTHSDLFK